MAPHRCENDAARVAQIRIRRIAHNGAAEQSFGVLEPSVVVQDSGAPESLGRGQNFCIRHKLLT